MINNMYNDTVISPYLTMLAQTEGITKEKVKSKVAEGLNEYTEMSYKLYLKEDKIAGIKLDAEIYHGVKLMGELNVSEFEEFDYTMTNFENVIDLDALTIEQENMLWDEVYENKEVIEALVSDKVIEWVK